MNGKALKYALILFFNIVIQSMVSILCWWCAWENHLGMIAVMLLAFLSYLIISVISGIVSYVKLRSVFIPTLLLIVTILLNIGVLFYMEHQFSTLKIYNNARYVRCTQDTIKSVLAFGIYATLFNLIGVIGAKITSLFVKIIKHNAKR